MDYHINRMMQGVRICLDQNMQSEALIETADIDTLALDEIIKANIEQGARIVLENAPLSLIGRGDPLPTPIVWESAVGHGAGYFQLPDDFLRLVAFRMSDWNYALHDGINDTDKEYAKLRSRFRGISGTPQRPRIAFSMKDAGLYLEFYSCSEGKTVSCVNARYLPIPRMKDEVIRIPEKLYDAVLHMVASLTAKIYLSTDQANLLAATAKSLMEE